MRLLLLAFILFPLLELAVLIQVGSSIGVLATLLLILAGVMAGGFLLRIAGPVTVWRARAGLLDGEAPEQEMLGGLLLALGGVLLLLPGFISDILGILCLLPFTRHLLCRRLKRRAECFQAQSGQAEREPSRSSPQIIEGEWERRDD